MVDDDHQVANHLRVSHQHVIEGIAELQYERLALVEVLGLLQLIIIKHPGQKEKERSYCFEIKMSVLDHFFKV